MADGSAAGQTYCRGDRAGKGEWSSVWNSEEHGGWLLEWGPPCRVLYVVYLANGGRESQSEPAVRVIARAYMDCNYLEIDCLLLHVMTTWLRM